MNVKFIFSSFFVVTLLLACMSASDTDFLKVAQPTEASAVDMTVAHTPINQDGGEKKGKKLGKILGKVKDVVDGVKGKNFVGTWTYVGVDLKIKGDDLVSNLGGQIAGNKLESTLDKQLTKIGIQPGRYELTFNEDSTYTAIVNKRTVEGTYSYDKETKTIVMTSKRGFKKSEMTVEMHNENMSLLYDSSKFLDFAKGITGTVSKHASLKIVDTLLSNAKGMFIGMKFEKKELVE